MTKTRQNGVSRRRFLKWSAFGAGGAIAAPYVITSNALGANGRPPASERIVMGSIGLGGRGMYCMRALMGNADVEMVAVTEVIGQRRASAKAAVDSHNGNSDCTAYIDLRDMLARTDIDAVLVATGDNWHSLASIMAARAGKDIYCEKPVSVVIAESRALTDTITRHARIFQCGMQRRNVGNFVFAANLARSGKLGKLKELYAEKARQDSGVNFDVLPPQPMPDPEEMDWDMWLGPAPWRPYNSRYYTRGFWSWHGDFSGGSINEWGSHTADLCQWANDADHTSPIEYEIINENQDVSCLYENGARLILTSGLRFGSCPVRFEGEDGWVETGDSGQIETYPRSLMAERNFAGGYPADNHIREFLNCVKSRRQPSANAEVAHRSITACHAANICVRLGRKVHWDPVKEAFINDEAANRLCSRAYRQPWRL